MHLGDSPTISLSNNNRLKNPELWASKDIRPQQQSAAAQNRSDDRKPMLNAPAPFATGDDLETHDLFNQVTRLHCSKSKRVLFKTGGQSIKYSQNTSFLA
jgi:trehalose-6-phosphatase